MPLLESDSEGEEPIRIPLSSINSTSAAANNSPFFSQERHSSSSLIQSECNSDTRNTAIEDAENGENVQGNSPTSSASHHPALTDSARRNYRQHAWDVSALTWPIVASEIFQNTLPTVDLAFVGRMLSKDDLAAAALATVWFNLWNATMLGFTTAIDTLLAQSYGAGEVRVFGVWMGRSLVIVACVTVVVAGVLALCGPAMRLFGQDADLATAAGEFTYRLLPGLFPYYAFKVGVKYLQTQNMVFPGVVIGFLANALNVVLNWQLIDQLGINGAPWATTLTRFAQCIMLVIYCMWYRKTKLRPTWPSLDLKHFQRKQLRPFWKMSISGALSIMAEAWSFEITTILAGLLGTTELDAHVITLTIATFLYLSFAFAIGIAASIRIGQLIGEGFPADAQRSCLVSCVLAVLTSTTLAAVVWPSREFLGNLFSSDEDVSALAAELIPISCIFMMGDAVQATLGGSMRGLGRQKLVLLLNILAFWILALPIGSLLTFVADIGVQGLWWGMTIGIYSSAALGAVLLRWRVDWRLEAEKAHKRVSAAVVAPHPETMSAVAAPERTLTRPESESLHP